MEVLREITDAVSDLDEAKALGLVDRALGSGLNSDAIVRAVQSGLSKVGERYEREEIYLAGLIMAGEIFRGAMQLLQPGLQDEWAGSGSGRVVLGTVAGDIHDIGKNMAALALRMRGLEVTDLGVNVPPEQFLETVRQSEPDIVGMSGLLVVAFDAMKDTVTLIREHASELKKLPLFVAGGGTINEQVARHIGADLWADDAMEGARKCLAALESRR